jgi:hypothetical protein
LSTPTEAVGIDTFSVVALQRLRSPSMAGARFCSECGTRLKVKRRRVLPFRSFCPECSPHYHRMRLLLVAVPLVCAAIGFSIGHYTTVREPFYLIGTPVDLSTNSVPASSVGNVDAYAGGNTSLRQPERMLTPSAAGTVCGAQTKSGKPCRRKVKGGGHCWQHRTPLAPAK